MTASAMVEEALGKLETGGDVVIDFSPVRRLASGDLRELRKLAHAAEEKSVKVGLCGVDVFVYRVLKLAKLDGLVL